MVLLPPVCDIEKSGELDSDGNQICLPLLLSRPCQCRSPSLRTPQQSLCGNPTPTKANSKAQRATLDLSAEHRQAKRLVTDPSPGPVKAGNKAQGATLQEIQSQRQSDCLRPARHEGWRSRARRAQNRASHSATSEARSSPPTATSQDGWQRRANFEGSPPAIVPPHMKGGVVELAQRNERHQILLTNCDKRNGLWKRANFEGNPPAVVPPNTDDGLPKFAEHRTGVLSAMGRQTELKRETPALPDIRISWTTVRCALMRDQESGATAFHRLCQNCASPTLLDDQTVEAKFGTPINDQRGLGGPVFQLIAAKKLLLETKLLLSRE